MPKGVVCTLGSSVLWGLLPLYLKTLAPIPALEVLAHRILWAFLCAGLVLLCCRKEHWLVLALRCPQTLAVIGASAVLLGVNWLLYLWAVTTNHVVEASLGYFLSVPWLGITLGTASADYALLKKSCCSSPDGVWPYLAGASSLWVKRHLVADEEPDRGTESTTNTQARGLSEETLKTFVIIRHLVDMSIRTAWSITSTTGSIHKMRPIGRASTAISRALHYTAVELRAGVFAGVKTPALNQSEV